MKGTYLLGWQMKGLENAFGSGFQPELNQADRNPKSLTLDGNLLDWAKWIGRSKAEFQTMALGKPSAGKKLTW